MISKDKQKKLEKYLQHLINRLEAPVPEKHSGHPETFRLFLTREIGTVKSQLDAAKLEGTK